MKVFIIDDYQNIISDLKCYTLLNNFDVTIINKAEKNIDELSKIISDAEILVLTRERTKIDKHLLEKLPKLKLISQTGKVSNHINIDDCTRFKVAVAQGVGSPIAPSELTWALIMNAVRKIPEAINGMKAGKWQTNIGSTVFGKTIGIWGYGKIGKRIAQYGKAFGANILVWGSNTSRELAINDGFNAAEDKETFFRSVDILSLHLRLNSSTEGIVKAEDLNVMKPTSILVNTARAELIEKGVLVNALKSGRPGYAALDVYLEEPILNPDFEFLLMKNVICTPHLGYVELSSYELYFEKAFNNIIKFYKGKYDSILNPEVLK